MAGALARIGPGFVEGLRGDPPESDATPKRTTIAMAPAEEARNAAAERRVRSDAALRKALATATCVLAPLPVTWALVSHLPLVRSTLDLYLMLHGLLMMLVLPAGAAWISRIHAREIAQIVAVRSDLVPNTQHLSPRLRALVVETILLRTAVEAGGRATLSRALWEWGACFRPLDASERALLSDLGVRPDQVVVAEESPAPVPTARHAGIATAARPASLGRARRRLILAELDRILAALTETARAPYRRGV